MVTPNDDVTGLGLPGEQEEAYMPVKFVLMVALEKSGLALLPGPCKVDDISCHPLTSPVLCQILPGVLVGEGKLVIGK